MEWHLAGDEGLHATWKALHHRYSKAIPSPADETNLTDQAETEFLLVLGSLSTTCSPHGAVVPPYELSLGMKADNETPAAVVGDPAGGVAAASLLLELPHAEAETPAEPAAQSAP